MSWIFKDGMSEFFFLDTCKCCSSVVLNCPQKERFQAQLFLKNPTQYSNLLESELISHKLSEIFH